jgi:hypothetical protein
VLWREVYKACVLETDSEKLKALIHEAENALVSRLQTLETPDNERQEIARASASLLILKSERLSRPGHPDNRNPQLPEAGSEKIREHPTANVQSCAEYEQLFNKCLDAVTRWTLLHGFDDCPGSMGAPLDNKAWHAERNYAAAFSALHQHARCGCVVCEEGLRVHVNEFPGATTYRNRELALWEHRKSLRELTRRLSVKPIKTGAMAPQTVIPERPPMSIHMAKLDKVLASWNCLLDRWWSLNFTEIKDWMILSKMGFAGVVLLTIALRISPLSPWPQIVRVPFGFSGILLIDVSLGFGAFLFLCDGNLSYRIRHLREWLHAFWSMGNG